MPHQVVKATSKGSVGDLAKITAMLRKENYNIIAVGGGEGRVDDDEVGVVAMILEPDDDAHMRDIIAKLRALPLDNNRRLKHVDHFPHVEIELADEVGQLERAVTAVHGINILSVVTIFNQDSKARVSLGFSQADHGRAEQAIRDAGIPIHPHDD